MFLSDKPLVSNAVNKGGNSSDSEWLKLMLEQMREELKETKEANRRLMDKVLDSKADPIGQINETMDLIERLRNPEEVKEKSLTDKLVDKGLELAPLITGGLMQYLGSRGQGNGPIARPFTGQEAQLFPVPGPAAQPPLPPMAVQPAAHPEPMDRSEQLRVFVQRYGGILASKISAGDKGNEFAWSLDGVFGQTVYAQVAQYTAEEILAALNSVAEFRNSVRAFSDDQLRAWIADFLNYESIPEREEATV